MQSTNPLYPNGYKEEINTLIEQLKSCKTLYLENNKLKYIASTELNVDKLNNFEEIHYKDSEFDKGGMTFVKMFRSLKSLNVYINSAKA